MTTLAVQYQPGVSPLHRLDPRVKIVLAIVLAVALFTRQSYVAMAAYAAAVVLGLILSGLSARVVWSALRPALILIVITFLAQLLFTSGPALTEWGPFHISAQGLERATFLGIRLVLLVLVGMLLTMTTAPVPLTDGLAWLLRPLGYLRVPTEELALMVTIALRFIPTLLVELDTIMRAQQARGADFRSGGLITRAKALVPVLVPLFVLSFRRADDLALAMEARCYTPGVVRTRLHPLRAGRGDAVFLAATAAVIALAMVL